MTNLHMLLGAQLHGRLLQAVIDRSYVALQAAHMIHEQLIGGQCLFHIIIGAN